MVFGHDKGIWFKIRRMEGKVDGERNEWQPTFHATQDKEITVMNKHITWKDAHVSKSVHSGSCIYQLIKYLHTKHTGMNETFYSQAGALFYILPSCVEPFLRHFCAQKPEELTDTAAWGLQGIENQTNPKNLLISSVQQEAFAKGGLVNYPRTIANLHVQQWCKQPSKSLSNWRTRLPRSRTFWKSLQDVSLSHFLCPSNQT